MTSQNIRDELHSSNLETIQSICREINDDFYHNIKEENILASTVGEGIKFVGNLKYIPEFMSYLYRQDINYKILTESFFSTISPIKFCDTYGLSLSTLKRKVIEVNKSLAEVELEIQLKNTIQLIGDESKRRVFLFYLINYVVFDLKDVPKLVNLHYYSSLASSVLQHTNFDIPSHLEASFILWLYIVDFSVRKKNELEPMDPHDQSLLSNSVFIKKPKELSHWDIRDWRFYSLFNSINGIFSEDSMVNLEAFKEAVVGNISLWVDLFKKDFKILSEQEEDSLLTKCVQVILLSSFIYINEDLKRWILRTNTLPQNSDPELETRFEKMWSEYLELERPFPQPFFKLVSFLLVRNLYLYDELRTPIYINLKLSSGTLLNEYVTSLIYKRFSNDYRLSFMKSSKDADLIITTKQIETTSQTTIIFISDSLSEEDFSRIEMALSYVKRLKEFEK